MDAAYPHPDNSLRNAAVGAVVSFPSPTKQPDFDFESSNSTHLSFFLFSHQGSDYFGACWENRIKKEEVDIVFVEHG